MLKLSKGLRKRLAGRLLSFLLALTVAIVPLCTSFSSTALAAPTVSAITLQSAVIGNANQEVTLTFNVPVVGAPGNWQSLIEVKRTNDGAFNSLTYYDDYASISDTGAVIVHFDSPLVGAANQIRVKAGALVGQDPNYVVTSNLVSGLIAAQDLSAPELAGTAISSDLKHVTLTMNATVQTATYTVSSATYDVDLYNYINIGTMFDPSGFVRLTNDDQISVSGNQMLINFASPLSGFKQIQVLEGAIQGDNGNKNYEMYADLNTNPITYSDYELDNYNADLDLQFSQGVINNTLSDEALKAAITISKNDGEYTALGAKDTASVSDNSSPRFSIRLGGNGNLHLHFFTPLAPGSYKVKIAAHALKSSIGLAAGEITTDSIAVSDITAPIYQKAEVSADRKVVTLTFDKKLIDNTYCQWGYDTYWNWVQTCGTTSHLSDYVTVLRSEGGWNSLDAGDEVVLSDNKLMINLQTALTGANNKIFIESEALKDESGNVLNSGVVTRAIDVSVTAPPQYLHSTIDNLNQDWTLLFDKNVKSNLESMDELKAAIKLVIDGSENSIDPATTVTFTGDKMVLHFPAPLVDNDIRVYIAANTIADTLDNVLIDPITTDSVTPNDFYPPQLDEAYLISSHSVMLYFNTMSRLIDNTIDTTGSHLKEAVTYSTDKGATFSSLQAGDAVNIYDNHMVVYFHNVIQGNLQIKVSGNSLKDEYGNIMITPAVTDDINTNYYFYLTGSFFSNAPSVLTFDDNAVWRSKIQKVVLREYANGSAERVLSTNEYSISAGKLTIQQGVFDENTDYRIYVYSDGFDEIRSNRMSAIQSQRSFGITPVTIDTTSGITAKVKIMRNESDGHLNVIFQLMNGQTPVSIVAAESEDFYAGAFTANFNVADAATNPNYTVRAFVVSEYSNSPSSVGVNLATPMTEAEYDLFVNADY